MSNSPTPPRSPWAAAALSLVSTGLGHVYCGRIVRGLALFCASLLFAPLAYVLALIPAATPVLVALIVAFVAVVGLYLFAAVDDEGLLAADGRIGDHRQRDLEAVFEVAQMAALVVEHIERDVGPGAHHEIVGRALHQYFFKPAQQLQRY